MMEVHYSKHCVKIRFRNDLSLSYENKQKLYICITNEQGGNLYKFHLEMDIGSE